MNMRLTVFHRIMMCAAAVASVLSASAQTNIAPNDSAPANDSAAAANSAPIAAPPSAPISGPGAEVFKLAQSGVGDDVVIAFVNNSTSKYNLSADDILALKDAGLSQNVISAMISHDHGTAGSKQTGRSPAPVMGSNNPTVSSGPSYEQKLYASSTSSTPANQYAPQYSSPTVPNAPTVGVAPVVSNAQANAQIVEAPASPPAAPRQVEVVPVSPGPAYYWVPGYWAWRGGGWVWIRGTWVLPPRHGAVWVSGHWASHGHGYVWVGGGWR
jgi:hypothetical protein